MTTYAYAKEMSKLGKEIWKWIPGFKGYYKVSNLGRVKGVARIIKHARLGSVRRPPKILTQRTGHRGHKAVCLWKNHELTKIGVHVVMLMAFKGSPKSDRITIQTRHLDGNSSNNKLYNLRQGSFEENYDDRRRHGTDNRGERNGRTLLNEKLVRKIKIAILKDSSKQRLRKIAQKVGVSLGTIEAIKSGRNWGYVTV